MVSTTHPITPEEFTPEFRAGLWVRRHIAQFKDGGEAALDSIASYAATSYDSVAGASDFATYAQLRCDRWAQRARYVVFCAALALVNAVGNCARTPARAFSTMKRMAPVCPACSPAVPFGSARSVIIRFNPVVSRM